MPRRDQFNSEAEWLAHLRLYFAAKAMAVLLQHALETELGADGYDSFDAMIAELAYTQADAMLAARSTEAK